MNESVIAVLCKEAQAGELRFSRHYAMRLWERPMPDRGQIRYLLCADEPEVIERRRSEGGRSYLIWGIMEDERVGHVLCSDPPMAVVITAYWPDTEPFEWQSNYKRRVPK